MSRRLIVSLCVLAVVGGCARPEWPMEMKKPTPGAELKKLQRLVGNWTGTAEMVSPSPEEMKAMMPEGSEEMPSSYAGGGKYEWGLGGMFLKGEGWHEMGEGLKANYVEYWTWDPKAGKYRTWYFSDFGESGAGWAKFSDANTIEMKMAGLDAEGYEVSGGGTMTFVDDNLYNWTWSMKSDKEGKMEFKGTGKRQK